MSKVAVICNEGLAHLFEGFGIDAFQLKDKDDPKIILEDVMKNGYVIIYILEEFAFNLIKKIDAIRKEGNISIVLIPDHIRDLGLGMAITRSVTIDAIGTDAIFSKREF